MFLENANANINLETQIPYGYISSNELDPDLVTELLYSHGLDLVYLELLVDMATAEGMPSCVLEEPEKQKELAQDWLTENEVEAFFELEESYEPEQLEVEGVYEGVRYRSSWLGGALNFFIFESPVTTYKATVCSPCVPNAGNLDKLDGEYHCYDVPASWRRDDE